MASQRTGLIGVGYEGRDLDSFCNDLVAEDVRVLVDVRLNAISRRKGFSKRKLSEALALVGIEYLHLRALGNPPANRPGFADTLGTAGRMARRRFELMMREPDAADAIGTLAARCQDQLVAVMCYESDASTCHREIVIDEVDRFSRVAAQNSRITEASVALG